MMERPEFDRLVRDALASLYDYAALETHPLARVFPRPADREESRAEHLRRLLLRAIERLRPPGREPLMDTGRYRPLMEWRPYLILHGRYVEGVDLQELQDRLSLSARQLRREHGRSLRAVATLLWDQAFPGRPSVEAGEGETLTLAQLGDYQLRRESLDLAQVVRGVARTLQRRLQSEDARLSLALPAELPLVRADRVIVRQVVLSMVNYALHVRSHGDIALRAEAFADQVRLTVQFQVDDQSSLAAEDEEASLDAARHWAQRIGAALQQASYPLRRAGSADLILALPREKEAIVLVVDDQEPAIRMFQRYLSRCEVRVVGVREPDQVLPLARRLQPQVITLDVMMPTTDGWEILQALQADPETRHIPVVVCSVWDEPELSYSLGAADFLKKPITRQDLLGALVRLRLLDTAAGSSPADT